MAIIVILRAKVAIIVILRAKVKMVVAKVNRIEVLIHKVDMLLILRSKINKIAIVMLHLRIFGEDTTIRIMKIIYQNCTSITVHIKESLQQQQKSTCDVREDEILSSNLSSIRFFSPIENILLFIDTTTLSDHK